MERAKLLHPVEGMTQLSNLRTREVILARRHMIIHYSFYFFHQAWELKSRKYLIRKEVTAFAQVLYTIEVLYGIFQGYYNYYYSTSTPIKTFQPPLPYLKSTRCDKRFEYILYIMIS